MQLELIAHVPELELMFERSIPGPPQAWQRARLAPLEGGGFRHVSEGRYRSWRRSVGLPALHRPDLPRLPARYAAPVVCHLRFIFPRPDRAPQVTVRGDRRPYPVPWTVGRNPCLRQQDVDNLTKAVLDLLQLDSKGITPVLDDDRFVVGITAGKWYAAEGEEPHTELQVWRFQ